MWNLKPFVLIVLFAISTLGDDVKPLDKNPPPQPPFIPPPIPPASSSTIKPTPSPTTTPKPTTSKPTVPPTTKPTSSPTTKPTQPTTAKPTPTPAPKPTTIAPPTPVPDPTKGTWVANYTGTNRTCILAQVAIQIQIPYSSDNTTKTLKVNVPPTANSTGSCDGDNQSIRIYWQNEVNTTADSVTLNFAKNGSVFDLKSVDVTVNVTIPGKQGPEVLKMTHNKEEFSTPVSKSYKCVKEQNLNLNSDGSNTTSILRIGHVHLQAFHNASGISFGDAVDCAGSETPDVVPIAVGCALAALVIIVLAAYLIGRRRSQARGYLSM